MKAISGEAEALTSRKEINNIKNVDGTGKNLEESGYSPP